MVKLWYIHTLEYRQPFKKTTFSKTWVSTYDMKLGNKIQGT